MSSRPSESDDPDSMTELTDFAEATQVLQRHFVSGPPRGYIPGKTQIRNALEQHFNLSAMEAEDAVEELEARGFIRYHGNPREVDMGEEAWILEPMPASIA